ASIARSGRARVAEENEVDLPGRWECEAEKLKDYVVENEYVGVAVRDNDDLKRLERDVEESLYGDSLLRSARAGELQSSENLVAGIFVAAGCPSRSQRGDESHLRRQRAGRA